MSKLKRQQINNYGFSLVEVVVVVVILAIVSTIVFTSISSVTRGSVTSASKRMSTALDKARILSLTKTDDVKLVISFDGSTYLATVKRGTEVDSTEEIGSGALSIKCIFSDASSQSITASNSCEMEFSKKTGGQETDVSSIEITSGDKTTTIVLVKETGRYYLQ